MQKTPHEPTNSITERQEQVHHWLQEQLNEQDSPAPFLLLMQKIRQSMIEKPNDDQLIKACECFMNDIYPMRHMLKKEDPMYEKLESILQDPRFQHGKELFAVLNFFVATLLAAIVSIGGSVLMMASSPLIYDQRINTVLAIALRDVEYASRHIIPSALNRRPLPKRPIQNDSPINAQQHQNKALQSHHDTIENETQTHEETPTRRQNTA